MSLSRPRTRRHLSITSLIDVIFLLLLFFMLASTFTKFAELEVGNSGATSAISTAPNEVMRLVVDEHALALDGHNLAAKDLVDAILHKFENTQSLNLQVTSETSSQRLTDILILLDPIDGLQVNMSAPS